MSEAKFGNAICNFIDPVSAYLQNNNPSCTVYMIQPSGSELNRQFALPLDEVEQYVGSFMFGGSYVAMRTIAKDNVEQLQIVIWDDRDGSYDYPSWPTWSGEVTNVWVWNGDYQDRE